MPLITGLIDYWNGRGRFLVEAVVWWLVISLPINMVSILFAAQAPEYVHSDEDTYYVGYGYNSIANSNVSTFSVSTDEEGDSAAGEKGHQLLKKGIWKSFCNELLTLIALFRRMHSGLF